MTQPLHGAEKTNFKEDEEAIFDNAVIYKRGEYWHMRMWLPKEHKYALSVFKWFETDGLISQRRDWLIGFKV